MLFKKKNDKKNKGLDNKKHDRQVKYDYKNPIKFCNMEVTGDL